MLRLPCSSSRTALSGSFRARRRAGPEEGHAAEIQISGSAGSVFMADDRFRVWEFRQPHDDDAEDPEGARSARPPPRAPVRQIPKAIDFTWHQRNFEDAVDAIRSGRPPRVDGAEGRRAVALIRAIYESAQSCGERVSVD